MTESTRDLVKDVRLCAEHLRVMDTPIGGDLVMALKLCDAVEQLEGERKNEQAGMHLLIDKWNADRDQLREANAKMRKAENRACGIANSLTAENGKLREALEAQRRYSECPCCGEECTCVDDCTYTHDDRDGMLKLAIDREANAAIDAALKPVDTGGET